MNRCNLYWTVIQVPDPPVVWRAPKKYIQREHRLEILKMTLSLALVRCLRALNYLCMFPCRVPKGFVIDTPDCVLCCPGRAADSQRSM